MDPRCCMTCDYWDQDERLCVFMPIYVCSPEDAPDPEKESFPLILFVTKEKVDDYDIFFHTPPNFYCSCHAPRISGVPRIIKNPWRI